MLCLVPLLRSTPGFRPGTSPLTLGRSRHPLSCASTRPQRLSPAPDMRPVLRAFTLVALLGFVLLLPALRAAAPANAPKASLVFDNWEKFTDIAVSGPPTKAGCDLIFRELERHLASLAKRYLAPGETLVVTMHDIDLAGAIEPWRGPDFGRIRYMRDTQPPRLAFDYQVLDPAGRTQKQGTA